MANLNADTLVVFLIIASREFHFCVPAIEKALSEFCSGTRYDKLAGVGGLEQTAAWKQRNSSSCMIYKRE